MQFNNEEAMPDQDDVLTFDYFIAVHKLSVEFALKLISEQKDELRQ